MMVKPRGYERSRSGSEIGTIGSEGESREGGIKGGRSQGEGARTRDDEPSRLGGHLVDDLDLLGRLDSDHDGRGEGGKEKGREEGGREEGEVVGGARTGCSRRWAEGSARRAREGPARLRWRNSWPVQPGFNRFMPVHSRKPLRTALHGGMVKGE